MNSIQYLRRAFLCSTCIIIAISAILQAQGKGPDSTQVAAFEVFNQGHGYQIYWSTQTGTPEAIFGVKAQQRVRIPDTEGLLPEVVAREFLIRHREIFKMGANLADLEITRVRSSKGIAHVRFQQTHQGVPIVGGDYFVHVNETDKSIHMANGRYFPDVVLINKPDGTAAPSVSEQVAVEAARHAVELDGVLMDTVLTRLVVYPKNQAHYLAWEIIVVPQEIAAEWRVYLDAEDGDLLWKENILQHINGTGRVYPTDPDSPYQTKTLYRLYSPGWELRGPYVRAENDDGPEAVREDRTFIYNPSDTHFDEVNVYYHADIFAYDFIGLGYPGLPYQIPAIVHEYENWDNAGYSPTYHLLRFGDGDVLFNDLAKKDDVIYHEYTHAISDDIGLAYNTAGESAAMNEAYSDYFAATFTSDPIIGEWVCRLDNHLRALNTSKNLWNYVNYDSIVLNYNYYTEIKIPDEGGNHYANGMIWSGSLWDLRVALNNSDLTDELVYGGLEYANGDATFLQGRAGIIQYDEDYYSGAHVATIMNVFTDRGISPPPLTVSISGPSYLDFKESATYTANASGGTGSYTYQWYRKYDGASNWYDIGSGQTQRVTMVSTSFTLKVVVTSGDETDEATKYVQYKGDVLPKQITNLPESYALSQNSPNPFNPATTIRYDLPEASHVSLTIYDMMGREVKSWRLQETASYKQVVWDGRDNAGRLAPTGIYIYRFTATSVESDQRFTASRKMVFMK